MELQPTIDKLRPHIKAGVTRFLFAPVFRPTMVLRVEYDDQGKRKVFCLDMDKWKEHNYIDSKLDEALSNSGYSLIQSVSRSMLRGVKLECMVLSDIVLATSCVFTKFKQLDNPYHPNTLMMLPDHCLSMFPYFVRLDFAGAKPAQATVKLEKAVAFMCGVMSHRQPSEMLRGSRESIVGKIARNYPTLDCKLITSLAFIVDN